MPVRVVLSIVFNITGFAEVIFVIFKTYKLFSALRADFVHASSFMTGCCETIAKRIDKRIDDVEVRVGMWREEELEEKLETLQDYVRRIHSGLILNAGFVERGTLSRQASLSYNIRSETHAANYLARRSRRMV